MGLDPRAHAADDPPPSFTLLQERRGARDPGARSGPSCSCCWGAQLAALIVAMSRHSLVRELRARERAEPRPRAQRPLAPRPLLRRLLAGAGTTPRSCRRWWSSGPGGSASPGVLSRVRGDRYEVEAGSRHRGEDRDRGRLRPGRDVLRPHPRELRSGGGGARRRERMAGPGGLLSRLRPRVVPRGPGAGGRSRVRGRLLQRGRAAGGAVHGGGEGLPPPGGAVDRRRAGAPRGRGGAPSAGGALSGARRERERPDLHHRSRRAFHLREPQRRAGDGLLAPSSAA